MRRCVVFLGLLVAVAAVSAVTPSASLAVCDPNQVSGHCFGEIDWIPTINTYTGVSVSLVAGKLTGSSSEFSNVALWNCDLNVHCYWWSETGVHIGKRYGGQAGTSLTWYWAEQPGNSNCNNGQYSENYVSGAIALGEVHAAKISHSGSGRWGIYRDGSLIATTSVCHDYSLGRAQAGGEVTAASNLDDGNVTNAQKRGADGSTWSYNWGGSTLYHDGPFSVAWYQQYQSAAFATDA